MQSRGRQANFTTMSPKMRVALAGCVAALLGAIPLSWFVVSRRAGHSIAQHAVQSEQKTHASRGGDGSASTQPTSRPGAPEPVTYLDAVRVFYPRLAQTQPFDDTLELSDAAALHVAAPIYLSSGYRPELWITLPDAPTAEQALRDAAQADAPAQEHVLRERVVFVHWLSAGADGQLTPRLIRQDDRGCYEMISQRGRTAFPTQRDYHFELAFDWDNRIVVPTDDGISVLTLEPALSENHHTIATASLANDATRPTTRDADSGQSEAAPATQRTSSSTTQTAVKGNLARSQVYLSDPPSPAQGLLVWRPWENGLPGSSGVSRFANGQWTDLASADGWPMRPIHLVPLLDGSILELSRDAQNARAVALTMSNLTQARVDDKQVDPLVDQLSDADSNKREEAMAKLRQFGPAIWPLLQRRYDDEPPEAQVRLKVLLHEQQKPTLGGMSLLGARVLQVAQRFNDGSAVFYAEEGVSLLDPQGGDPTLRVPAWISIRPGHPIEPLAETLTRELTYGKSSLSVVGNDWYVSKPGLAPRLFIGDAMIPLVRKEDAAFDRFIGIDWRGRRLVGHLQSDAPDYLIVDPTLADPTPRLPGWELPEANSVGWDAGNWPAVENGSTYALQEHDWRLMKEGEHLLKDAPLVNVQSDPVTPSTTQPTTQSSVAAATGETGPSDPPSIRLTATRASEAAAPASQATQVAATTSASERPILITADGTQFFGGLTELRIVRRGQPPIVHELPAAAVGHVTPHLAQAADGRLFLFNEPGRMLRLNPLSDAHEPLSLEATFTQHVPIADELTRMWIDPAGRIDIAWKNRIVVLFPRGFIPRDIAQKMPAAGPGE